jgi:4-methylaminobutanoate oxidase (formaldehyde-forming)
MKKVLLRARKLYADLAPIVGEAPNLRGYFVAAGLNSVGILTGGGIGASSRTGSSTVCRRRRHRDEHQPRAAVPGEPRLPAQSHGRVARRVYKCHYPFEAFETARGARRSAFHERLAAQGAYFIETSGWESPGWYAGAGKDCGPGRADLEPSELVAAVAGRAPRGARGRDRHGHVVHGQVPRAGDATPAST